MSDNQEQMAEVLRHEFIDECTDKIETIGKHLEALFQEEGNPQDVLKEIRVLTNSIKGSSAMYGFPAIGIIVHRLEEYLSCDASLGRMEIKEVYEFFDQISALLEKDDQPEDEALAKIVRALPIRMNAEQIVGDRTRVEVLLVMPKNIQQRLIAEEIRACGFHVTIASSIFQAVELAALTRPDLVLTSAVLDHLDGVQFAHMIRAMTVMKNTPLMFITSFADPEKQKEELPDDVIIVRKGNDFPGDFSDAAIAMGLLGGGESA